MKKLLKDIGEKMTKGLTEPRKYNIVWDSPSKDSSGSMPIGNGDIGLNAWVEEDGDLLFYIGKTDAWSENGRLLKLGRVRLSIKPKPFEKNSIFRQELKLDCGEIQIEVATDDRRFGIKLWVDANHPVIRIQVEGSVEHEVNLKLENWRIEKRVITNTKEINSGCGFDPENERLIVYPDTVIEEISDRILWYHRNESSMWENNMMLQGLQSLMVSEQDPLIHRTFGGMVLGEGLTRQNKDILTSLKPVIKTNINIFLLTEQTETVDEWIDMLNKLIASIEDEATETAYQNHLHWWERYWDRSSIYVSGNEQAKMVSQGYMLQRYINACGGRGDYPIKFNGSIFTVDAKEPDETFDADYRRWGGGYWFQNTRLTYWTMLMSGDYDLMDPWFQMYLDILPLAQERTRIYFDHEGAFFPETMTFWGTYLNINYGYDREGKHVSEIDNRYIRWYWQGGLELIAIMLDRYEMTQDAEFLNHVLLPIAIPVIDFYKNHYTKIDEDENILIKPAQALETWHEAVNPLPDIAGLNWVIDGMLRLPDASISQDEREVLKQLIKKIPSIPKRYYVWENISRLIPALQYDINSNSENVALYAVFPYRFFGIGKPDIESGRATYNARPVKASGGWRQDAIQAAMLGLTEEAKRDVAKNFSSWHSISRFPGFWGPNFDWIPDQDHGAVSMIALQRMLMQCEGSKVFLFPAWPKEWDVEFKLHAPYNTVIEGAFMGGRIQRLEVTPEHRRKDICVWEEKKT